MPLSSISLGHSSSPVAAFRFPPTFCAEAVAALRRELFAGFAFTEVHRSVLLMPVVCLSIAARESVRIVAKYFPELSLGGGQSPVISKAGLVAINAPNRKAFEFLDR